MKPQFFIIAGPNGAGKSSYVRGYVPEGTFIFNGDQVYADLLKRYPNYDPTALGGGVAQQLEQDKNAAIVGRKDFCFESNYSTDMATEMTEMFIDAGYETNLIYFGLDGLDAATSRVKTRVALGGHNIEEPEIRTNLENGILLVKQDLALYHRIQFVDTSIKQSATIVAHYIKDATPALILYENVPWFEKNFKLGMEALDLRRTKQIVSPEITIKPKISNKKGNKLS